MILESTLRYPAPKVLMEISLRTDLEQETRPLYGLVRALKPNTVLELGTRRGISTRVIAQALVDNGRTTRFVTLDPDDCSSYLEGVPIAEFQNVSGEDRFAHDPSHYDFMFVDTDPHSFEQTKLWLDTWVAQRLNPGGLAVFHDCSRTGVGRALRLWARAHPAWELDELGSINGLAVLRSPQQEAKDGRDQSGSKPEPAGSR